MRSVSGARREILCYIAQIAVEDRFLAGRIWFEVEDAVRATREALRRLNQNAPVIFTNSLHAGRSFVAAPVRDRFVLPLATTPLGIAARKAVPLHVVTTIQVEPFARYVTHVSPDLAAGDAGAETSDSGAALALRARDIILGFTRSHPDRIRIWDALFDPADCGPADLATAEVADRHPDPRSR